MSFGSWYPLASSYLAALVLCILVILLSGVLQTVCWITGLPDAGQRNREAVWLVVMTNAYVYVLEASVLSLKAGTFPQATKEEAGLPAVVPEQGSSLWLLPLIGRLKTSSALYFKRAAK